MSKILAYRRFHPGTQPEYDFPFYASTARRHPTQPLVIVPQTLSEITGPVFGADDLKATDNDLTRQHKGDPIGERIIVSGRVLDENGRPMPHTLVEVWQANAAGRYPHQTDTHNAPVDPNFRAPAARLPWRPEEIQNDVVGDRDAAEVHRHGGLAASFARDVAHLPLGPGKTA